MPADARGEPLLFVLSDSAVLRQDLFLEFGWCLANPRYYPVPAPRSAVVTGVRAAMLNSLFGCWGLEHSSSLHDEHPYCLVSIFV